MSASERGTADRLTDGDRDRMRAAVVEMVTRCPGGLAVPVPPATLCTLERVGAHAVGCGLHDLRDSERGWLHEMARGVVHELRADEDRRRLHGGADAVPVRVPGVTARDGIGAPAHVGPDGCRWWRVTYPDHTSEHVPAHRLHVLAPG